MATTQTVITTRTTTTTTATAAMVKKPGPPVPPRPQYSSTATSILKTQRESIANATTAATNRVTPLTTATATAKTTKLTTTSSINAKGYHAVSSAIDQHQHHQQQQQQQQQYHHPVIQAMKPSLTATQSTIVGGVGGGRTVIYKSPSFNLQKKQLQQDSKVVPQQPLASKVTNSTTTASRPPLKLRKAPDVPIKKSHELNKMNVENVFENVSNNTGNYKMQQTNNNDEKVNKANNNNNNINNNSNNSNNGNIVIVHSSNGVSLNRHHSMGSQKTTAAAAAAASAIAASSVAFKDTRLSLGRVDFDKMGKIQLNQLQPSQPLPKPRKIVKMPVATLDVDDDTADGGGVAGAAGGGTSSAAISTGLFRRSKTTLDNFASRANVTTISTVGSPNGFLSGKTVEIKNNLKNAAERLFSEIINQQKQPVMPANVITKHERALQYAVNTQQTSAMVTVVTTTPTRSDVASSNCTRININTTNADAINVRSPTKSPEKKTAFHEILISELAAMRAKSASMENLNTTCNSDAPTLYGKMCEKQTSVVTTATTTPTNQPSNEISAIAKNTRMRCNSLDDHDPDTEDVDDDNIEDTEDYDGDNVMPKTRQTALSSKGSPRKRSPSGCSSDSSPYGTERSARIRTSDWIEVADNGKAVTMSSCHISLEDSGLEDEERLDDMSSSGVGDSWDSVKEAEQQQQQHQQKRNRSVKRVMSFTELPPLPKSLSGINKMLGSDSGLLSDVDGNVENNINNNNNNNNYNINGNKNSSDNKDSNIIDLQKDMVASNIINGVISDTNSISSNHSKKNNNKNNSNDDISNDTNDNVINNINNNNNDSNEESSDKENNQLSINEVNANERTSMMMMMMTTSTITTTTTTVAAAASSPTATTPLAEYALDAKLATLKKEMYGLRQLDLSLLSQLWALNDSIQEFRTMIEEQDQDQESCSPHSRTPSSYDSASSDGEDELTTSAKLNLDGNGNQPKIITTQPKLNKSNSIERDLKVLNGAAGSITTPTYVNSLASTKVQQLPQQRQQKPPLPKPLEVRPVPRMRSAPPPPPTNRKAAAPPRPT